MVRWPLRVAVAPAILSLALCLAAPPLLAQIRVTGIVRDSLGRVPIERVFVTVIAASVSALTDADGRFMLVLPPGSHTLELRRFGYQTVSTTFAASESATGDLEIFMTLDARELAPVRVTARRGSSWPPGFEERRASGDGVFITDSTLRAAEGGSLGLVLERSRTGIRFERINGRNIALGTRGGGSSGRCHMSVWVNGMLMYAPDTDANSGASTRGRGRQLRAPTIDLDAYSLSSLTAIEVYRATAIPAQFRSTGVACGAILLWSKSAG